MKKPLRIGLLLDSRELPAWAFRMLEIIRKSDFAEIALVVLNQEAPPATGLLPRTGTSRNLFLYRCYRRFEDLVCRPRPDAFRKNDASGLLEGASSLHVTPDTRGPWDVFDGEDLAKIEACGLDVMVQLGFRLLKGKVLECARYGVWSYYHGDSTVLHGDAPGFWEVFEGHPVTGTVLQVLDGKAGAGQVLARSWSATRKYSVRNNRNNYYWKSLSLLPRKLRDLHRLGGEAFFQRARREHRSFRFYDRPRYLAPGNRAFLGALTKHALRSGRTAFSGLMHREDWTLMYRIGKDISTSFWQYDKIVPSKDRFWADPHVIQRDGRYYIFLEEVVYPGTKGHISLIVMEEDGSFGAPVKILDQPWHLAYPMVFEWEGSLYMAPDSSANSTVDVYRCDQFPLKWSLHKRIMKEIRAVDPTLLCQEGRWWLFANVQENPGASFSDELFLYSSDSPLSEEWTPHPRNPIVSDARKARPAGRFLEREGRLFRFSQNCSRGYGYGINVHQVTTLNDREYEEKNLQSLEPKWDPDIRGMHTFSHAGGLTLIDAKVRRRRFP